jgi:hypothetical protein
MRREAGGKEVGRLATYHEIESDAGTGPRVQGIFHAVLSQALEA